MFLRSLTLSGFKSFADTTTLAFEPGVTVVVGPNGSGKSNVVDAIAWVLGAQGPRTLRGQRMDDVVFAGTDRRTALGRALVTLVIDNESQTLPIQTAEVAITRTLFRSGESEYALNGTPCRLLDLQELLNDAGVGRQQHIIVAQGQITGVLAARPEERRALIEEAAGVLKFRRRKERAERRLEGTEANVTRLVDLQRELRRQLRPLERQATAARRHREISAELAGLQLYNAGRQLAASYQAQSASDARQVDLAAQQDAVASSIDDIDRAIDDAQSQLAELTEEPADRLPRVASLSERARGLIGQTYERMRSVERERNALLDSDVVATLTDEHARVSAELTALDASGVSAAGSVALAVGTKSGAGDAAEFDESAASAATEAHREAAARLETAAATLSRADEQQRNAAEERQHWIGRFEALASAVAAARTDSGIAALDGVAGVVGVLGDLVIIDDGWEAAAEAAADGALSAVIVRDDSAASAALAALADGETNGSVISLAEPGGARDPSRRNGKPASPAEPAGEAVVRAAREPGAREHGAQQRAAAGAGSAVSHLASWTGPAGEFVRPHVQVAPDAPQEHRAELEALLDAVVGAAICVPGDWSRAYDRALAARDAGVMGVAADAAFVTSSGDRFGPHRWRIGSTGPAAATAALDVARARIDELTLHQQAAAAAWTSARQAHQAAFDASREAQRTAENLRRRAATAAAQHAERIQAFEDRAAAQEQRRSALSERLRTIEGRLRGHESSRAAASARLERAEAIVSGLDRLALLLSERRQRLDAEAKRLRSRNEARIELARQLTERLDALRRERDAALSRQEHLRTELAALDVADAERRTKRDALVEMLRTELSADPAAALAAPPPPLPDGVTAIVHERTLRADLHRLGPVNPLALSEYEAASERFEFVATQLADVRNSRRELHKVIRAIDAEIVATFAAAFEDVARNFARLFGTLFPGGAGKLSLTDPQELLTSGVELDVRPAGKHIGRLSLLSGGERSLVALAYLFAVFRSRPSPFYVLDEVEAALDDVNLQRFLDLVAEFRRESQLIIVSHQRRTMESADVLYGVSMPPGGSSVVVSERPEHAAALVAADGPLGFGESGSSQLAEPATTLG
ncbi:chromosome segregation SMC family protein [Candidatus Poriferisodalis sp.]|uniref:chromosome segregation SMC family protein n=1 Tax=Candidatus Poriferisodalis sp. TaxID=3101277 RepID=UPI003B02BC45